MTGTNTPEYRMFRDALGKLHLALEHYIPGLSFDEVFFQVLSCQPDDTETLEKTDFASYYKGVTVINGISNMLVDFRSSGVKHVS